MRRNLQPINRESIGHRQILVLLHTAQQQVSWSLRLVIRRAHECEELLVVPLASSDISALGVGELGVVLSSEEIGNGVAVLIVVQWYDSVDARLEGVFACEAERVADVDDGSSWPWCDETEFLRSWRADLKTPLLTKEESERADVGVLLVSNVVVGDWV